MGHRLPDMDVVARQPLRRYGAELKAEFPFDPDWLNLNHGSWGSIPRAIQARLRYYQEQTEARPDRFIRFDYPRLLDESRAAAAALVRAPVETVVLVANATDGVNTVLRNLAWARDGRDVVLTFSTAYEACAHAVDFVAAQAARLGVAVGHRVIPLRYPVEDAAVERALREAVAAVEAAGRRARLCLFDVVSSRPGVAFPWVRVAAACRELGVASLVDGAQGVGMVPLDLPAADPDFFVSNCHKWLHVPRGCALFYVPVRNQHLLPSTLATSNGYRPAAAAASPTPDRTPERELGEPETTPTPRKKSHFEANFEYVGTKDNSPYLCVKDALAWRRDVLGGEHAILAYLWRLNKQGGRRVAAALRTRLLDNAAGTLTDCAMSNVALPVWVGERGAADEDDDHVEAPVVVAERHLDDVLAWAARAMVDDYRTYISLFRLRNRLWARISAQVYLGLDDYDTAARVLLDLSRRIGERWG